MRDKSLLIISKSPPCAQEGDLVKFTPVWRTGSSVGQSGGLIIPWSWVQVPPGPPTANRLLHDNLPRFVVPWLPHANDCAVRLNLINVCAGNPDLLRRIDRSRNDRRSSHHRSRNDGSRDDARADDCVSQNATDNTADESWPEMTPPASPRTVMAMVHRGRRRAVVHHGARPAEAAAMTAEARAGTGHKRSSRQNRAKYKYHFLVHFVFPFSAFAVT